MRKLLLIALIVLTGCEQKIPDAAKITMLLPKGSNTKSDALAIEKVYASYPELQSTEDPYLKIPN